MPPHSSSSSDPPDPDHTPEPGQEKPNGNGDDGKAHLDATVPSRSKSTPPLKSPIAPTPTPTADPGSIRRVVLASFVGTTIEWYDYFLFSAASALVFPALFFPALPNWRAR